jgi:hypothetical protein
MPFPSGVHGEEVQEPEGNSANVHFFGHLSNIMDIYVYIGFCWLAAGAGNRRDGFGHGSIVV